MLNSHIPENQVEAPAVTVVMEPNAHPSPWSRIAAKLLDERWLIRLALLLLFGLYLRSIGFAPVYDDNVMSAWEKLSDVPKFFAHDIFGSDGTAHSVYYRPLALTWGFLLALGTGGAPGWLHLGAIFLHLSVVILAYVFGRHLFRDNRLALLSAVLFGLHPTKVESVAWIGSSCVDGLSGVFFFASLIMFFKWNEGESSRWRAASVALFACAMFTKETMVFIPVLIAVYLWLTTPAAGRISRTLRTLLPYAAVWIVYSAIRHQVIRAPIAGAEYMYPTFTPSNLWTAPYSIWWYIRHLVLPWGFAVEYAANVVTHPTLRGFVLPGIGVLVLIAAAWWMWRRQRSPIAAFLIVWFVLTLAPAIILAPMVSEHDRYLYLPAYAFCALVAWAALYLGRISPKMRLVAALSIVALWSGLTWHEMGYWDCDKALWTRVLEISPAEPKAHIQLAGIYNEAKDVPKALSIVDDGLLHRPNSLRLWLVRAEICNGDKQYAEAQAAYLKIMQLTEPPRGRPVEPGLPTHLRAAAAYQLAVLNVSAKNYKEAENYLQTALGFDFKGVGYHATLSQALAGEGRMDEAKAENALELQLRLAHRAR